jgi:hypothetical protein
MYFVLRYSVQHESRYRTSTETTSKEAKRQKQKEGGSDRDPTPLSRSLSRSLDAPAQLICLISHLTARAVLNSHARLGTVWSVGKSCHFWTRHYPCSDPLYYPCGPSFPVQSSCKEPRNLLLSRRKHLLYSVGTSVLLTVGGTLPYLTGTNEAILAFTFLAFAICHLLPWLVAASCCLLLPAGLLGGVAPHTLYLRYAGGDLYHYSNDEKKERTP